MPNVHPIRANNRVLEEAKELRQHADFDVGVCREIGSQEWELYSKCRWGGYIRVWRPPLRRNLGSHVISRWNFDANYVIIVDMDPTVENDLLA